MRRFMKLVHTLSAAGLTGGLAAYMAILATAPPMTSAADYAAVRAALEMVSDWLLVPSMGVAILSGLLAMAVHHPFQDAGWVWIKAVLGLPIFEATLGAIDSRAAEAAAAARRVAAGELDPAMLADALAREWRAYWVILALCVANVVIGIWRPRLAGTRAARSRA